jgi:hypothetical protein
MTRCLLAASLLLLAGAVADPAAAQTAAETEAAIRAAALDYIEGWYTGDATRMERALHPKLAKRALLPGRDGGPPRFDEISAEDLIDYTRRGGGRNVPADERAIEVRILDRLEGCASVRVDSRDFIDYMHLARFDGQWKIVNVFWELRSRR